MKRFIIAAAVIASIALAGTYLVLYHGIDLWFTGQRQEVTTSFACDGRALVYIDADAEAPFEMRGVDIGGAEPGHFATDYATSKETYLRWFEQISQMGANTVRVYMLMAPAFYEALEAFNASAADPLYLLQGVYLDDYAAYSHMDAYDADYLGYLVEGTHDAIDAVHGRLLAKLGEVSGTGSYTVDVSRWVAGYALGVPWDTRAVAYTDQTCEDQASHAGDYVRTTDDASPFEAMLARLADECARYETARYGAQRLIGIVNAPTTDPFTYPQDIADAFNKHTSVDIEHIQATAKLTSGIFALYHIYPFDPTWSDYLSDDEAPYVVDEDGDAFGPYLSALVEHHSCPVVIGEFGIPSSRGLGSEGVAKTYDRGINEAEQAEELVRASQTIDEAGCAGQIVFEWTDDWSRRTWNTVYATDQLHTPYWSDAQTMDQGYGLVAFDPGDDETIVTLDGDAGEWEDAEPLATGGDSQLRVTYDERYLYLCVSDANIQADSSVTIPLDVLPETGATSAALLPAGKDQQSLILTSDQLLEEAKGLPFAFSHAADFVVRIDGDASCLYVQERADATRAMMLQTVEGRDPYTAIPAADSTLFKPMTMALKTLATRSLEHDLAVGATREQEDAATREEAMSLDGAYLVTGALHEGNSDPESPAYDSLADFCFGDGCLEIRIPWQLLGMSDPSSMRVHRDYYENFGVEDQPIECLYAGVAVGSASTATTIEMDAVELEGWGASPAYHERLKPAYDALRRAWSKAEREG